MAIDIARAWKDPEYRKTLTPEQLASLPPNPAGNPSLSEEDLGRIAGGIARPEAPDTMLQCTLTCTLPVNVCK